MAKRQIELPATSSGGVSPLATLSTSPPLSDPLSEEQAASLLTLVDVIRDPLHVDVRLTALERRLVDTPAFQRLRNVNQLAMTYMAYPGAVHTRFIHSLGVLHVCSQMIETCNSNARNYRRLAGTGHAVPLLINSYGILLARLCALLHDLAHVPFGHTLEKEGRVFLADEWQDRHRLEKLLGDNSHLAGHLSSFFEERQLPKAAAHRLLADIRDVLSAKAGGVLTLPFPFVHDLVGNTICADLIDYVQRDMYFCGLTESLGKRFLEYLAVIPVEVASADPGSKNVRLMTFTNGDDEVTFRRRENQKGGTLVICRLVLLQYRYNERGSFVKKHDILAEAIDLVRRRLTVAEKLYFHRTKLAASSMLITAAYSARLSAEDLCFSNRSTVFPIIDLMTPSKASAFGVPMLVFSSQGKGRSWSCASNGS